MYGCASDYDLSLQEQMEFDLKAEMDRLLNGSGGNKSDLISDLETPPLLFDEGFDELGMKLESYSENDVFGLGPLGYGLGPIVTVTNTKVNSPSSNNSRHKKDNARLSAKIAKSLSSWNKRANGENNTNGISFEETFGVMVSNNLLHFI